MDENTIKTEVRNRYAAIAKQANSSCCSGSVGCCSSDAIEVVRFTDITTDDDQIISKADLGLGCGFPTQYAQIRSGDTVLDLGSGAGVDVFRAANQVGPEGWVIGVDMTPEMIAQARDNAAKGGYSNVEFRLGEIENLPVQNESVDLILSNCVVNLVPDKRRVFQEVYRVLKTGGRFTISDVVTYGNVPEEIRQDMVLWAGCVAGAVDRDEYVQIIKEAGFSQVCVHQFIEYDYLKGENYGIASTTVEAVKE